MTENQTYNTPSEGSTDWHVPLNANFGQLDADVEIRDSAANRSNYAPKEGAKFLATDTREVYLGDGSQWNRSHRLPKVFVEDNLPSTVPEGSIVLIR